MQIIGFKMNSNWEEDRQHLQDGEATRVETEVKK